MLFNIKHLESITQTFKYLINGNNIDLCILFYRTCNLFDLKSEIYY